MSEDRGKLDGTTVRLSVQGLSEKRYERVRNQYTTLYDIEKDFRKDVGHYSPYIVRDIWSGLNNPTTPVDAKTDKAPIRGVVEWAIQQMKSVPGYSALANDSRSNIICSTLATKAIVKVLSGLDWPPPPPPPEEDEWTTEGPTGGGGGDGDDGKVGYKIHIEDTDQGSDVLVTQTIREDGIETSETTTTSFDTRASAEDFVRKLLEALKSKGHTLSKEKSEGMAEFEKRVGKMLASLDGMDKQDARDTAEAAVAKAAAEAEDIIDAITTCYGTERAEHVFKDPTDADMALVRKVMASKKLAEFIRIVGRFMKSMRRSRVRERVPGKTIPIGTTRAKDLRNILPMEAALLSVPGLKAHQVTRVLTRQAAGHRTWDYSSKGNGPVHVALDISGSMESFKSRSGVYYGNAFACAAALYSLEQKRPVTCSVFDTVVEVIEVDGSSPERRYAFIEAMLTVVPRGGTAFDPLMRHIEGLGYCDDVLLISDGCGSLDPELAHKVFRARNLNYLVIGGSDWAVDKTLKEISGDRMILANDLLTEDASKLAARAVARK
jgi:uncharacterized protein with von Willebrand factor type A (vWA) domain